MYYRRQRISNQERIRQALEEANQSTPSLLPPELLPPQSSAIVNNPTPQDTGNIRGMSANLMYWDEPEEEPEYNENVNQVMQQIQEQLSEIIEENSTNLNVNINDEGDIRANHIIGGMANFGQGIATFNGRPMGTVQSVEVESEDGNQFRTPNIENSYVFGRTQVHSTWGTEPSEHVNNMTSITVIAVITHAEGTNAMSIEVPNFFRTEENITVRTLKDEIESGIDRIINNRFFYFNDYNDDVSKLTMMHRDSIIKMDFYIESDYLAEHPRRDAFQSSNVPRITI